MLFVLILIYASIAVMFLVVSILIQPEEGYSEIDICLDCFSAMFWPLTILFLTIVGLFDFILNKTED